MPRNSLGSAAGPGWRCHRASPSSTHFLAAGTKAPVEQAELGKLTPAGPQSQLGWGHGLSAALSERWLDWEQHSDPQDKGSFPCSGLGGGEGGSHSPWVWVPGARPPSSLTLVLGQEQISWAGICIQGLGIKRKVLVALWPWTNPAAAELHLKSEGWQLDCFQAPFCCSLCEGQNTPPILLTFSPACWVQGLSGQDVGGAVSLLYQL